MKRSEGEDEKTQVMKKKMKKMNLLNCLSRSSIAPRISASSGRRETAKAGERARDEDGRSEKVKR